jgi:hypothetical protein
VVHRQDPVQDVTVGDTADHVTVVAVVPESWKGEEVNLEVEQSVVVVVVAAAAAAVVAEAVRGLLSQGVFLLLLARLLEVQEAVPSRSRHRLC